MDTFMYCNWPKSLCWEMLVSFLSTGTLLAAAPYPSSDFIESINWNWSSHKRECSGSDNWAITWADDGHQYAAWGDGGGFGGTNSDGRVSLGFARVENDVDNYKGYNVWGGKNAENKAQFGGKSYGIISIGGVLYAWVGPGSGTTSYDHLKMCKSTNHAASWQQSSWELRKTDKLIMPTICNFGKDYAGARDNYVYHYFIELQGNPSGLGVHKPGKIHLARCPKGRLMDRSAYEFCTAVSNGTPSWSSDIADSKPVFEDPAGVGWCMSVSYNAGLKRYLLCTEHTETFKGHLGIFDAAEPWGPWTTVEYNTGWGSGNITGNLFFWNFSNKWTSSDGKNTVCVFTGTGDGDTWNLVKASYVTKNVISAGYRRQAISCSIPGMLSCSRAPSYNVLGRLVAPEHAQGKLQRLSVHPGAIIAPPK